ncbi:MAG: zf-TFIIB domain-containing protein [Patescibacteria group bacterium]
MKKCPQCKLKLEQVLLAGVEVDYCPSCYGLWFEENELEWAKDEKDRDLRWLDIDLWKNPEKFQVNRSKKLCPTDRMPLYEVLYGDANVRVDVCSVCHGVWLDRGEFIEIIEYLKEKGYQEVMHSYAKNLLKELWEVFSGPELLKEEVLDFFVILKILRYKFAVQHPVISQIMLSLPR